MSAITEPIKALATVEKESFLTLAVNMTDDALATYVIGLCNKIREMLPYIAELKRRFDEGERDSQNQLRTPIKGCVSWKSFCTTYLNRTPQAVGQAFAAARKAKELAAVTGESIAQCELDRPGIRQFAQKLLAAPDLTPADVASTLVAQYDISEPMAEAIVKLAGAENEHVAAQETPDLETQFQILREQVRNFGRTASAQFWAEKHRAGSEPLNEEGNLDASIRKGLKAYLKKIEKSFWDGLYDVACAPQRAPQPRSAAISNAGGVEPEPPEPTRVPMSQPAESEPAAVPEPEVIYARREDVMEDIRSYLRENLEMVEKFGYNVAKPIVIPVIRYRLIRLDGSKGWSPAYASAKKAMAYAKAHCRKCPTDSLDNFRVEEFTHGWHVVDEANYYYEITGEDFMGRMRTRQEVEECLKEAQTDVLA